MTLERFLEIVNNKEYKKLDHKYKKNAGLLLYTDYIDIYTKNGAFIRFYNVFYLKKFFGPGAWYYDIYFFIPDEDTAVASFRIEESSYMYKTLTEIFDQLVKEVKKKQANKYF